MKIARVFIRLAIALGIAFLVVRLSQAQTNRTSGEGAATNNDSGFQELVWLHNYLHDTGQTNALKHLSRYLDYDRALQFNVNLALTVGILNNLREGKTNEL